MPVGLEKLHGPVHFLAWCLSAPLLIPRSLSLSVFSSPGLFFLNIFLLIPPRLSQIFHPFMSLFHVSPFINPSVALLFATLPLTGPSAHTPPPFFHITLAIPLALPMSLPLDQHDPSWSLWPTSERSGALLNPQDLLEIAGLTLATEIRGGR